MNNACFIYEDTFDALLNLIFYLLKNNLKPLLIKNTLYTPTLLDNVIHLKIKPDKNIIKTTKNKLGSYIFKYVYCTFLSEEENKELIIYYFILNYFKYHEKVIHMRNLKCVNKILKITNYVVHESHKYKGFIRFKELKNHILYVEIAPTNNILSLITHHFKERLKMEYWIIKDTKRGILCMYDKKNIYFASSENFTLATTLLSCDELETENLWKTFYKTIGIKERKNERCRMNFMPKKYWKYMIEMESEL